MNGFNNITVWFQEEKASQGGDKLYSSLLWTRWTMIMVWRRRHATCTIQGSVHTKLGCNLKLVQKRGLQFYQTRSHAIVLCNTLPTVCIEKAESMKTKEVIYHKVCLTPRLPRVVLKANSHSGQQDQRDQDERSSWDPPRESKSNRETWGQRRLTT